MRRSEFLFLAATCAVAISCDPTFEFSHSLHAAAIELLLIIAGYGALAATLVCAVLLGIPFPDFRMVLVVVAGAIFNPPVFAAVSHASGLWVFPILVPLTLIPYGFPAALGIAWASARAWSFSRAGRIWTASSFALFSFGIVLSFWAGHEIADAREIDSILPEIRLALTNGGGSSGYPSEGHAALLPAASPSIVDYVALGPDFVCPCWTHVVYDWKHVGTQRLVAILREAGGAGCEADDLRSMSNDYYYVLVICN